MKKMNGIKKAKKKKEAFFVKKNVKTPGVNELTKMWISIQISSNDY